MFNLKLFCSYKSQLQQVMELNTGQGSHRSHKSQGSFIQALSFLVLWSMYLLNEPNSLSIRLSCWAWLCCILSIKTPRRSPSAVSFLIASLQESSSLSEAESAVQRSLSGVFLFFRSSHFGVSQPETELLANSDGEGIELSFRGDSPHFVAPVFAVSMPACSTLLQVTRSLHPRIASSTSKWGLLRRCPPNCRRFHCLLFLHSVRKCFSFLWHR